MLHLALELILLVFATSLAGLAAGFGAGKLRNALNGARPHEPGSVDELPDAGQDGLDAEPPAARRIPDPAPPSELRRKRLLNDPPAGQA